MAAKSLKVAEFSKLTGLSIKALRLYEQEQILVPERSSENRYRLYSPVQAEIAREIRLLKSIGFSVKEIKALLPFKHQERGFLLTALEEQLAKTNASIRALSDQKRKLKGLIINIKKHKVLDQSAAGPLAKALFCKGLSESIKRLKQPELSNRIRMIPNEEFLRTVAMVDLEARAKLMSAISERAVKLVSQDLKTLDDRYANYWK